MVQLWIHSSVATLEAYKSESGVEPKCYEYNRSAFGMKFDHAHGRHRPTY